MSDHTSALHSIAENLNRPAWAGHYSAALAQASELGLFRYEAETFAAVAATLAERREATAEAARLAAERAHHKTASTAPTGLAAATGKPSPDAIKAGWRTALAGIGALADQHAEPKAEAGTTSPGGAASTATPAGTMSDPTEDQVKAGWAAAFARLPSGH